MPTVKLTSQNRITLPKEVRQAMNVKPGDIIEVIVQGRTTVLVPKSKKYTNFFIGKKR